MPFPRLAGLALALALSVVPATQAASVPPAALARTVAPRAADFPFGWVADTSAQGPGAGCLSVPLKAVHALGLQLSPKLSAAAARSQATGVGAVFSSASAAQIALRRVVAATAVECFHQLLVETLTPSKITVKPFTSTRLAFPKIGTTQSAIRYRAPLLQGKIPSALWLDIVFVQQGRVVVGVALIGFAGKPSTNDEHTLLSRAIARAS